MTSALRRFIAIGVVAPILVGWGRVCAAESGPPGGGRPTITNTDIIWQMTTAERALSYPLRVEARINYVDPAWGNMWVEQNGAGFYFNLSAVPPKLKSGQRVLIEGTLVPAVGLAADAVRVTVLREYEPIAAVSTAGRITEIRAFDRRVVSTVGYVDEMLLIDAEHLRLHMIVEDRPVICWVVPDDPERLPDWQGKFVEVKAVYSGRLDPTGTQSTVELWCPRQQDAAVVGTIAADPRFEGPATEIVRLSEARPGAQVRIRGVLQNRDPGSTVVIRDATGEVVVETLQRERIPVGTEVEAIGRTAVAGSRWIVQSALIRRALTPAAAPARVTQGRTVLNRVEQIRQLPLDEAARGHPVDISGLVTWSLPEADFFFVQDVSGGIRIRYPKGRTKPPPLQKSVRIEGVSYNGGFVPAVDLVALHDLGSQAHPVPKKLTLDQALAGGEDGQWVQMRGFIRRTESDGDWRWIYVTTPAGEFVGHLWSPVNFIATPGSLIRVQGVCETAVDANGRISGVTLRVPFLHDISIEEDAPADIFDLPVRPVNSLRQYAALRDMTRARISGTVVEQVPGQYFTVVDGVSGLRCYSRETQALAPGDAVDVVGILGREGARTVLREAVSRRTAAGRPPAAVELADPGRIAEGLDMRLVRVRGELIDQFNLPGRTRLTLQSGSTIFEALLPHAGADGAVPERYRIGTGLELTGVYQVAFDDSNHPRGFELQLRAAADVAVYRSARLWTVQRALVVAGGLGVSTLLVMLWVGQLRRRVSRQTEQIRRQVERQASLEAELERAQRLHSLGLLAGGIAHDFNNLLTVIMGNLTLAMLDDKAMTLVGDCLREAESGSKRARELTQQLITFSKGGAPMRESLDFAAMIREVGAIALSGARARLDFQAPPELWPVHGDRTQLARMLQNLIVHSRGEMPDGGIILVDASNTTVAEGSGRPLPAGRYVQVTIEDHGPGVAPERIPGFFDPYAATKFEDDRFALAIAYSIVKRHDGHIEVESQPGHGTLFRLWVPASEVAPASTAAGPAAPSAMAAAGVAGAKVLLMDDEESIRRLSEKLLRRMNCEPRVVADGRECVRVYEAAMKARAPFDLVILDLTVPGGMGGKETIAELRRIDPNVRAIVSSGYSNDPVMAGYRDYGFKAVVPKPYAVSTLADSIKAVLAER